MTKAERRRDKYIRRIYGRSLEWYNRTLEKQEGHCYCCDFVPKAELEEGGLPLHIEHDHRLAELHIFMLQMGTLWIAYTADFGVIKQSHKKRRAQKLMRQWLRRESVRGLVCWPCNSLIRKSYDQPDRLRLAGEMLDRHQKRLKWRKYGA